MLRNARGFTVIEIISVILVLGILAALALPRLNTSGVGIYTSAQILRSDLRFLQRLAMARNPQTVGAIGITFTNGATSYTIPDPSSIFNITRNLPSGVSIASPTKTISYNKYGEPEIAGATDTVQLTDGTTTLTITVERYTGLVTLS